MALFNQSERCSGTVVPNPVLSFSLNNDRLLSRLLCLLFGSDAQPTSDPTRKCRKNRVLGRLISSQRAYIHFLPFIRSATGQCTSIVKVACI